MTNDLEIVITTVIGTMIYIHTDPNTTIDEMNIKLDYQKSAIWSFLGNILSGPHTLFSYGVKNASHLYVANPNQD